MNTPLVFEVGRLSMRSFLRPARRLRARKTSAASPIANGRILRMVSSLMAASPRKDYPTQVCATNA
jgi:hypothetical protein